MSLKVFHTGDIHIGMKFQSYREDIKEKLVEARFKSLEKMINKSNDLEADIFVIAGDLFNSIKISKRDIEKTIKILEKFNGQCVLVLPGNHDYDNKMVDIWKDFTKKPSEKILLINEERPYNLKDYSLDVTIYPAPCKSKHSKENNLSWVKEGKIEEEGYHIGVAHGALEGISPDIEGNYYYMEIDELESIPVDLWLIGHTHIPYPFKEEIKNHKIYNGGTPEPDGLDYKGRGSAWFIELDGEEINSKLIYTGNYKFIDKEFKVMEKKDLNKIKESILAGDADKKIVRLTLVGSLAKDLYENIRDFYMELEGKLLYLIIDDSKLRASISKDTIEEKFTRGSFPYEFLNRLSDDEEALQMAYDILRGE